MWLHFRVVYCCSKKQVLLNALVDAKTESEKFVTRMKELAHRARSEHDWKDWKYDGHPMWTVKSHWRCINTTHKRKYTNIKGNSAWRWRNFHHNWRNNFDKSSCRSKLVTTAHFIRRNVLISESCYTFEGRKKSTNAFLSIYMFFNSMDVGIGIFRTVIVSLSEWQRNPTLQLSCLYKAKKQPYDYIILELYSASQTG